MFNRQVMTALKSQVIERAQGNCEYCRSQARFATQAFSIEHITPQSKGGQTALDNLALACQGCNNHKYNKTKAADPITTVHILDQISQNDVKYQNECTKSSFHQQNHN